jgi:hypothetical protein
VKYVTRRKCFQKSLVNILPFSYESHCLFTFHLFMKIPNTSLLQSIIRISVRVIEMKAVRGDAS